MIRNRILLAQIVKMAVAFVLIAGLSCPLSGVEWPGPNKPADLIEGSEYAKKLKLKRETYEIIKFILSNQKWHEVPPEKLGINYLERYEYRLLNQIFEDVAKQITEDALEPGEKGEAEGQEVLDSHEHKLHDLLKTTELFKTMSSSVSFLEKEKYLLEFNRKMGRTSDRIYETLGIDKKTLQPISIEYLKLKFSELYDPIESISVIIERRYRLFVRKIVSTSGNRGNESLKELVFKRSHNGDFALRLNQDGKLEYNSPQAYLDTTVLDRAIYRLYVRAFEQWPSFEDVRNSLGAIRQEGTQPDIRDSNIFTGQILKELGTVGEFDPWSVYLIEDIWSAAKERPSNRRDKD